MSIQQKFKGFKRPVYTGVPNELFDSLLPILTESELKVLLYIIRRTFGFGKDSDNISISQMVNGIKTNKGKIIDHGTGLAKASVCRGLEGLLKKDIIISRKIKSSSGDPDINIYSLKIQKDDSDDSKENIKEKEDIKEPIETGGSPNFELVSNCVN